MQKHVILNIVEGGALSSEMLVFPMFRRYPDGIQRTVDAENAAKQMILERNSTHERSCERISNTIVIDDILQNICFDGDGIGFTFGDAIEMYIFLGK